MCGMCTCTATLDELFSADFHVSLYDGIVVVASYQSLHVVYGVLRVLRQQYTVSTHQLSDSGVAALRALLSPAPSLVVLLS